MQEKYLDYKRKSTREREGLEVMARRGGKAPKEPKLVTFRNGETGEIIGKLNCPGYSSVRNATAKFREALGKTAEPLFIARKDEDGDMEWLDEEDEVKEIDELYVFSSQGRQFNLKGCERCRHSAMMVAVLCFPRQLPTLHILSCVEGLLAKPL